jgi:Insertion element 4 transposase N-terminal/Transposase DDE domain
MSWGWSSRRGRVLARAGIGVLSWVVAPELVDAAVGDGLAWEMRLRALPSRLGVYFVLGLCLFSHLPYGQVLRELTAGLEAALGAAGWQVPAATALTGVRRRIGEKPLESLFRRLCPAISPGRARWSHVCGLQVVAWDGTTVAAGNTAANTAAFGKPGAGRKRSAGPSPGGQPAAAYPQLRLVTLAACGTRGLLDAAFGPVRGTGTGERELAAAMLPSLRAGMLLLADRGFWSYRLWTAAAATGADLLWRVKAGVHLPVLRELPDGSYLTHINDPAAVQARLRKNRKRRRGGNLPPQAGPLPGITVRVIDYLLTITGSDGQARTERYRHITTLTGHRAYPAAELAASYTRRWAIETGYREFKTYLRGPGRVLRGRTPDLARQELWAYLVIYQAIHVIITRAATTAGLDPGQISFTATLHAVRRTIPTARTSLATALAATQAEILTHLTPQRHGRICPRAVNKPRSPYPSKHHHHHPIPQHVSHTITITTPDPTPSTPADQPRQPAKPPPNPP